MMKKILTKLGIALSILALSAFVTACGDGEATPEKKKEEKKEEKKGNNT
jgi:ABC-type oligopeptide transport system substrate-binding subunit